MKIKVGQWVRTHRNTIGEVAYCLKGYYIIKENEYLEVASTPRELIQIGYLITHIDLVGKECIIEVTRHNIKYCKKEAVKIFTSNEDKTVYTLQYSKEVKSND